MSEQENVDPREDVQRRYRYEVEDTYTEEEEEVKVDEINQFLNDNPNYHDELMMLYSNTIGGDMIEVIKLYQEVVSLNNILVNRLDDEEHAELIEKLRTRRENITDAVDPDKLFDAVDMSGNIGFNNRVVKRTMKKHGTEIKSYCLDFLSGTRVTSDTGL